MKPALTTQVLQGEMPPELNPFIMYYQMAKDLINVMYKKLSQPQLEYDSEDDVFGEDDFNNKENMYSSSPRSRGYWFYRSNSCCTVFRILAVIELWASCW